MLAQGVLKIYATLIHFPCFGIIGVDMVRNCCNMPSASFAQNAGAKAGSHEVVKK